MLEEIEEEHIIKHSHIERALEEWAESGVKYPLLLLAVPVGSNIEAVDVGRKRYKAGNVSWDTIRLLYLLAGWIIAWEEIYETYDVFLAMIAREVLLASQKLIFGKIPISSWRGVMETAIRETHIVATAIASGGFASMTPADYAFVEGVVRKQLDYLDRFVEQILSGKQRLDGSLQVRAKMYVDASRGTMQEARRRKANAVGFTMERRVLGVAEHCQDCITYASLGWQPIGTLPPIGDSVCRTNCHCVFEYR